MLAQQSIIRAGFSHADRGDLGICLIPLFSFPVHRKLMMIRGYLEHTWGRKGKIILVENEDLNESCTKGKDLQFAQPFLVLLRGGRIPAWHLCPRHRSVLAQISTSSFL